MEVPIQSATAEPVDFRRVAQLLTVLNLDIMDRGLLVLHVDA